MRNIISADAHILETKSFFNSLEKKFGDIAPQIVMDEKKGECLLTEDKRLINISSLGLSILRDKNNQKEFLRNGYNSLEGYLTPQDRIKAQEIDRISAEVIYPGLSFFFFSTPSDDLMNGALSFYNDWLYDFCSYDRKRLIGLALIPMRSPSAAVTELKRVIKMGYKGICIACTYGKYLPYYDKGFNEFWAILSESQIPVSLHIMMGSEPAIGGIGMGISNKYGKVLGYSLVHTAGAGILGELIYYGVLARFPGLKIVLSEWDLSWIPHYLKRLNYAVTRFPNSEYKEDILPSEYFQRNFYMVFEDDPIFFELLHHFDLSKLMWANDFPHGDSTWPHSKEHIDKILNILRGKNQEEIKNLLFYDNVAKLYDINISN